MKRSIASATLAGTLFLSSCSGGGNKAELPKAADAKKAGETNPKAASQIAKKEEVNEFRLLGQVSSQDKILLSFKTTNGVIRKLFVKAGSKVKKGQLLAELDDEQIKLRVDAAKLQLDKATNQLEQADRDFKIEKELREKDISSLTQFQNSELTHKNAVIARNLAEVDFRTAQQTLADSRIVAPNDGTISQQLKFAGDKADGVTFEMFALADPEIYLNAPESLLNKISVGSSLDVKFPSIDLKKKAKIVRIVPAVRETDRSFLVVANLVEQDKRIVPGIFAEAVVSGRN